MKKMVLAAGISLLLSMGAAAAEPVTLTDKADKLDDVIFGAVQEGSFQERVNAMDKTVYGASMDKEGLNGRIAGLYRDVVKGEETDNNPSISTRVNTMEYYLTDEIKQAPLTERVGDLETAVFGAAKTGALDGRTDALEKAIYGNQHFELTNVALPANTVFKISLNEDVSSKTNQEGDEVHFTVEEDVMSDDVLVLPRGAQGSGVITKVDRPASFGRSGKLEISFNQVFSIDDEEIPTVLGTESKEKLKKEAAAIGASAVGALALGPVGLIGGFFVKGSDVNMPAGTELYIQTQETVNTKGMKLAPGAPKPTARQNRSAVKDAAKADTSVKTEETAKTAAAETAPKETTAAAAPAEETAQPQEETKTAADAGTETASEAAGNDEEASVVIVRHE